MGPVPEFRTACSLALCTLTVTLCREGRDPVREAVGRSRGGPGNEARCGDEPRPGLVHAASVTMARVPGAWRTAGGRGREEDSHPAAPENTLACHLWDVCPVSPQAKGDLADFQTSRGFSPPVRAVLLLTTHRLSGSPSGTAQGTGDGPAGGCRTQLPADGLADSPGATSQAQLQGWVSCKPHCGAGLPTP